MGWAGTGLSTVLYKERGWLPCYFCVIFFRFLSFWFGLGGLTTYLARYRDIGSLSVLPFFFLVSFYFLRHH